MELLKGESALHTESLLNQTRLNKFILLSLVLHLLVILVQSMLPSVSSSPPVAPPPIQVKYIASKPVDALEHGSIVDAPEPKQIEKPRTSELLAEHDSRAHANNKKSETKQYKRSRTVAPKASGTLTTAKTNSMANKKDKSSASAQAKSKSQPFPELNQKNSRPVEQTQPSEDQASASSGSGGALALLDGFDASKYASQGTNSPAIEEDDDNEPVSLDTTETKYASYFARIKHQIERVWSYPLDAARKGLSGEMTINFKISKDGNLVGVERISSSGHEILDHAAIKAVKDAAPFYPFPLTIKKDKLSIMATFIYTPTYDTIRN